MYTAGILIRNNKVNMMLLEKLSNGPGLAPLSGQCTAAVKTNKQNVMMRKQRGGENSIKYNVTM